MSSVISTGTEPSKTHVQINLMAKNLFQHQGSNGDSINGTTEILCHEGIARGY